MVMYTENYKRSGMVTLKWPRLFPSLIWFPINLANIEICISVHTELTDFWMGYQAICLWYRTRKEFWSVQCGQAVQMWLGSWAYLCKYKKVTVSRINLKYGTPNVQFSSACNCPTSQLWATWSIVIYYYSQDSCLFSVFLKDCSCCRDTTAFESWSLHFVTGSVAPSSY